MNIFIDQNTNALELYKILNNHFKNNWFDWLPDSMWHIIKLEFKIKDEIPRKNKDKICALQLLLKTNRPWVEFEIFEKVSTALSNKNMNYSVLEPLEPEDAFIGLCILQYLRPDEKFSNETLIYITACFRHQGLISYGNSNYLKPISESFQKSLSEDNLKIFNHLNKIFPDLRSNKKDFLSFQDGNIIHVQLRKILRIYNIVEEYLKEYMVI